MNNLLELTGRAEATHFWFHGFRAYVAPVIAALADGRRDLRLIDCGCGTGFNLALLRPHGRAFGFDLMPGGLAIARGRGPRLPLVRADATHIPFASNSFDLVTSFDVLQTLEADEAAVGEMARIARPGGAVVLTLAALEILRGDHAEVWREAQRYAPRSARALAESAGLHVERVTFMFGSLFPLIFGVRMAQRALRPLRGLRDDTDIAVPPAPVNAVLTAIVRAEAALARRHVRMPFGSSLLVVARKPAP